MQAMSGVMQTSRIRPFEALLLAARVLGAIYHDTADAHQGRDACDCGWDPDRTRDVDHLLCALAAAAQRDEGGVIPTHRMSGRA